MINRKFEPNKVLNSMNYHDGKLNIEFKVSGQIRTYLTSPVLAYKLYHSKSATDSISIYSNEIKGFCTVFNVNKPK